MNVSQEDCDAGGVRWSAFWFVVRRLLSGVYTIEEAHIPYSNCILNRLCAVMIVGVRMDDVEIGGVSILT